MRKIVFSGEYYTNEKPTGIARYTYEIINELDKIALPGEIEVLAPKCGIRRPDFRNIRFVMIGSFGKGNKLREKIFVRMWKGIVFPLYCRMNRAFTVNTGLTWKNYNFDIFGIHDCIPDLFPDNCPAPWAENIVKKQKRNSRACACILTVSQQSRKDISRIYGIPLEKIEVVPNAWQHFTKVREDQDILLKLGLKDKEYFFSLGSRFPHKNIKWVAAAAKKHPQYTFVVTGAALGGTDTSFEGEIPDNMTFTGYLKDEEAKALMRHCKAFIQPSFYEGFGIPPMEAMSVGADCIVSNAGSLPEVYRNSVWYIDPCDYENIDLDEIMARPKDGNELVLNAYSWEKSAKMLLSILRERAQ